MDPDAWRTLLVAALVLNAGLGVAYHVYRLSKKGPAADVAGQVLLGALLTVVAAGVASHLGWARWAALGYGIGFGIVVMPVRVLAVVIPMRPGPLDYAFTAMYWALLAVVVVAAAAL